MVIVRIEGDVKLPSHEIALHHSLMTARRLLLNSERAGCHVDVLGAGDLSKDAEEMLRRFVAWALPRSRSLLVTRSHS
jgi:hypothetical protein